MDEFETVYKKANECYVKFQKCALPQLSLPETAVNFIKTWETLIETLMNMYKIEEMCHPVQYINLETKILIMLSTVIACVSAKNDLNYEI